MSNLQKYNNNSKIKNIKRVVISLSAFIIKPIGLSAFFTNLKCQMFKFIYEQHKQITFRQLNRLTLYQKHSNDELCTMSTVIF